MKVCNCNRVAIIEAHPATTGTQPLMPDEHNHLHKYTTPPSPTSAGNL
uniref:Uncharacterized protein n=1 Tax=Anguilla anguilla TaxID=7936 RepID=A0A0E9UWV0_ANGAN